jgi:very-short-patch-repair endonuclease
MGPFWAHTCTMARPDPGRQRHTQRSQRCESDDDGVVGRIRHTRPPAGVERYVDGAVGAIASGQLAVVKREQLIDVGVSVATIDHWLRRGRLVERHRGVYVLAHTAVPEFSDEMAAVLACDPRSLLSHASAAYVWGFRSRPAGGLVDVTVVGRQARQQPGIRVHRTKSLMRADARSRHNIPITSPARTVFDLSATLDDDHDLELALHEAIALKQVTIPQLRAVLDRYPHRRGHARLAELADPSRGLAVADSGGAKRLQRHLRRSGLPAPQVNFPLGRWRADFYWPEAQLVVELDGVDFHSSRPRIERDHRKDLELRTAGTEVLRFTGRQVRRELEFVLVTVAREYERRTR